MAAPETNVNPTERYRIDEQIGGGGLGAVYLAWDTQLKRRVAIKRIRPDAVEGDRAHELVQREATNLAALQHPNVVSVYDMGVDAQGPFAVMEFIEGENLEAVVARSVFILADFVNFARQLLEGLEAAHQAGLIHRDLKPGNVMLKWLPEGIFQVKLLDFGMGKLSQRPTVQTADENNTILGTIYTLAPEQLLREPIDARADLYSAGCIFYYVLAGRFPFTGETVANVITAHLEHQVIPLRQYRPDVPMDICNWVMQLMSRNPKQRPVSAKAAGNLLNAMIQGPRQKTPKSGGPVQMVAKTDEPATGAKSKPKLLWIALPVILLLAGAGGWFWWDQQQKRQQQRMTAVEPEPTADPNDPLDRTDTPEVGPLLDPKMMMDPMAPAAVYQATDLESLRKEIGRHVIIEGKIVARGDNRNKTIHYLNFADDYKNAASLVIFARPKDPVPPVIDLDGYIGRIVRADGILTEHRGNLEIAIRNVNQISLMD